jgi:hypothetical protein
VTTGGVVLTGGVVTVPEPPPLLTGGVAAVLPEPPPPPQAAHKAMSMLAQMVFRSGRPRSVVMVGIPAVLDRKAGSLTC